MATGNRTRTTLWRQQGHRCGICLERIKDPRDREEATIDHVWPRVFYQQSYGSRGKMITHRLCNLAKGNNDPSGCQIIFLHAVELRLKQSALGSTRENRRYVPLTPIVGPRRKEDYDKVWLGRRKLRHMGGQRCRIISTNASRHEVEFINGERHTVSCAGVHKYDPTRKGPAQRGKKGDYTSPTPRRTRETPIARPKQAGNSDKR